MIIGTNFDERRLIDNLVNSENTQSHSLSDKKMFGSLKMIGVFRKRFSFSIVNIQADISFQKIKLFCLYSDTIIKTSFSGDL